MSTHCTTCATPLTLTDLDREACERFGVPDPTMCTDCRHQRRTAFRNELNLYARTCDRTGKDIVSIYSPDKPLKVYSADAWWNDAWDGREYGREIDFGRPFFEQFRELSREVPLLAAHIVNSVNCDYANYIVDSKNCYLSARMAAEDCMYSYLALSGLGCIDCYNTYSCTYCYECVDCWNCYETFFSRLCRNTHSSWFCYDCIGCNNCFGSVGLRHKEYCFFNEQCTKEEYERKVADLHLGSHLQLQRVKLKFAEHERLFPHRNLYIINSENAHGDFIVQSKNVQNSFDIEETDTCSDSWAVEYSNNIYSCDFMYHGENCYEFISNTRSSNVMFSFSVYDSHDIAYSMLVVNGSHDCFGSIALKKAAHCILNKQYSKENYTAIKAKLTAHMKKTGEWGQFFPPDVSFFGYNETVANEYFPLTKEQAVGRGFAWKDKDTKEYQPATAVIPDNIRDVPDSIVTETLACERTGRNYKITGQELKFYRKYGLPLPRLHFLERHAARQKSRNPRKLYERTCAKTGKKILSTFAPDRPEIVLSEKAYREEVY